MEPTTMAAIGQGIGELAGSMINKNSKNAAAKKAANQNFLYNLWLQERQIKWERERATHAHQWEMQDLKAAGLNPALTATGGSGANTGGISGSVSAMADTQGLQMTPFSDMMEKLVSMKNNTRATNANSNLADAQALKEIALTKNIPFENKINMMNALSNRITSNANRTNAITNRDTLDSSPTKNLGRKINSLIDEPNDLPKPEPRKPKRYTKKSFYKELMKDDRT